MRLAPTFLLLPGQIERLAGVLPGLIHAPPEETDRAKPRNIEGPSSRARADTFADRLLQQRAPLGEASLEGIGITQARRDRSQLVAVTRGTTEGQATL